MVARGRGKKAAASEAVAAVANGDVVSQENEVASASVGVAPPLAKKGRARGSKKETAKEEVDETPPVEISEKTTKVAKASRGSKKSSKGKAVAEVDEVASVPEEKNAKELEDDDAPLIETKPAAVEKKTNSRKRKADSTEKLEEAPAPVSKKAPRTKTKGAKKETVDSAGVPEDPAASAAPALAASTPVEAQTNGNKKSSSSRKRAAPKIEEPIADEPIKEAEINEPEEEIAPPAAKKSSKSKSSKKEPKTKTSSKSKGSKKTAKEEDSPEDDILPEDEFVPEQDEDEEQQQVEQVEPVEDPPKVKKLVKSKGSRKQLKDDIPPIDEEVRSIKEEEDIPGKQDSEVDSVIEEEKKSKGKKSAKKASTKKAATKKTAKAKKATKDEPEPEIENEELDTDIEPPEGKTNGNAKPKAEPVEKKTARGGGGRKRAAAATPDAADETDRSKSAKPEVLLNPTLTEYKGSDFSQDKDFTLKISSWNVAGLRSWLKKDGLQYLQYEQPDILCLQEIKCTTDQLPEEARIPGYHPYWLCMPGGYAGVAVYSKIMPINVEYGIGDAEHDSTGRMITAEFEKFYLICVYVPNSGMKLVNLEKRMQWEELFRAYVQRLDKTKPVIIAGDMNVSHNEIDLANPKANTRNAGFTPQERDAMTKLLELGFVDTFRHFYPEEKGTYSFWSFRGKARSKNVGWRLDYFVVSERITPKTVDSTIRTQVLGSDHCPITLFINI